MNTLRSKAIREPKSLRCPRVALSHFLHKGAGVEPSGAMAGRAER